MIQKIKIQQQCGFSSHDASCTDLTSRLCSHDLLGRGQVKITVCFFYSLHHIFKSRILPQTNQFKSISNLAIYKLILFGMYALPGRLPICISSPIYGLLLVAFEMNKSSSIFNIIKNNNFK